jgi:hypothetical protein
MPTPTLAKNLASKAGTSVERVNKLWAEAEKEALKSKKKTDKDYWPYVTGIVKKMLSIKEDTVPVEETGAIPLVHEELIYTSTPTWRLLEAAEPGKKWDKPYLAKVAGTLMEFGIQNQNGRNYPEAIMEKIKANARLKNRLNMRALVAQANHPSEGLNTDINKVAGVVTEWQFNGNKMEGVLEILNTSSGKDVYELLKAKIPVGVSARGSGDVDRGGNVITESYDLITFDIVIDPSFESAVPKIKEIMERLTRDSNALCEGTVTKRTEVKEEEDSNMFEKAMCAKIVLENVYYDLRAVFETTDHPKYFSYIKSYLNEAAQQYFKNEKCYSVDWNKFWEIAEDVIKNHALYETQDMTSFSTLKEQDTMQVVFNLHTVLKLILETYDHDVRKMNTALDESFFMRYIGIVNKVSNLLETKSYKATKIMKEDVNMAFDEAKKDELQQDDEFVLVDDDKEEEAPVEDEEGMEEADCMLKDKRKDVKEGDDYAEKLKKDLPFDEDELPESDTHEGDTLADVTKDSNPKTDGMKGTSDNFAVKESQVRNLAEKYNLTMNEAATVLLANKIVEAKIHKGKKAPAKAAKKPVTIAKKAAKKESVEQTDKPVLNEQKAPDKIQSSETDSKKTALHESTKSLVSSMIQ